MAIIWASRSLQTTSVLFHLRSVMVHFQEMKDVAMSFVVSSVVLLCMAKNWGSTNLSFTNWFQLLEKSWKAITQKCLKNVTLSKKSWRAKKSHLLVPFTQVNTLLKVSWPTWRPKVNLLSMDKTSSNFTILMDSQLNWQKKSLKKLAWLSIVTVLKQLWRNNKNVRVHQLLKVDLWACKMKLFKTLQLKVTLTIMLANCLRN